MKIFIYNLRSFDEKPYVEQFSREYGYEYVFSPDYPSLENVGLVQGCDAVSIIPCPMDAAFLDRFKALGVKYIVTRSIGYDHIDLEHAARIGIRVSNVAYPPVSVADYTIMLMLMCCRKIVQILQRAAIQEYSLRGKMGRELSQSTVGIIGTGRIAATVLRHLRGFGCRLLACGNHLPDDCREFVELVDLDGLLRQSDIVSIHTNATGANHHLIDTAAIARMKDNVILVNTARGELIDTEALIDGLRSGKVGAAALDVLENENGLYYHNRMGAVLEDSRMAQLRSFPNVILSPHTAFYTDDTVFNMVRGLFLSVHAFAAGSDNPYELTGKVT